MRSSCSIQPVSWCDCIGKALAAALSGRSTDLDYLIEVLVGGDSYVVEDLVDAAADFLGEFPVGGGDVFFEFPLIAHADEGAGDAGVVEDPGDAQLGDGLAVAVGEFVEAVGDFDFLLEALTLEQREVEGDAVGAPVTLFKLVVGLEGAGEQAEGRASRRT